MKENYETPEVTIIEIGVEKGFAASIPLAGGEGLNPDQMPGWDF